MNKVITVNLNGTAYQVEESGYNALEEYLSGAAARLRGNPDLTEIMSDLEQAIAELYELMGQSEPAVYWRERALSGYLQSAQQSEVHYYHHLADYYSDLVEGGAAAVGWAYKDLQLRENFATQAALAWALYRDGQFTDAVRWIDRALVSDVCDARLYCWASDIYNAAGKAVEGRELRQRAINLNPVVAGFHIHH